MLIFPLVNDTSRKIIHIDMDAFFAAVEERDNPSLKGKPVVIGQDPRQSGGRGVVSTCNYEARKYGIHSAMSSKEALDLCPQAIFISGNYEKYREVGEQVREIFKRYTDLIEPMSIDEAYLDVTENKIQSKSAVKIARLIQHAIWEELHLTASAGVSYNKFLAKMASDYQKPRGLTVVLPEDAEDFLSQMDIAKFHGVGKKTVERLHEMGVYTGADLLAIPEMTLIDRFGRFGYDLFRKARGIHNSPVKSHRIRKSIGKERTYRKLLYAEDDILEEIVGDFTTSMAPSIEQEVVHQSDGSMIIEGSANLRDLNKMFGWELDTEDARTFNGLILEHLEDIPDEGTVCEIDGLQITILEVSDNMIKQAKVEKLAS